jgi:hypothetical protein
MRFDLRLPVTFSTFSLGLSISGMVPFGRISKQFYTANGSSRVGGRWPQAMNPPGVRVCPSEPIRGHPFQLLNRAALSRELQPDRGVSGPKVLPDAWEADMPIILWLLRYRWWWSSY